MLYEVITNVARCTGGSLEFLKDMVRQIGDNAKLVLDTKQAVRRGYNPYDFVKELGRNIVHIHLSDYNDTSDCALVGTGNVITSYSIHYTKLYDIINNRSNVI